MRVALVVGHTAKSQGASNPNGVTEWAFNVVLATAIRMALGDSYDCRVFHRPTGAYKTAMAKLCKEINTWGPAIVVSLHANASPEGAHFDGAEALHYPGSAKGEAFATRLSRDVAGAIGVRDRGARAQSVSWAGEPLYIMQSTKAPAVILETHFIDNDSDHNLAMEGLINGSLSNGIARSIKRCIGT